MRRHHKRGRPTFAGKRRRRIRERVAAEHEEQRARDERVTAAYGRAAHKMCGCKIRYKTETEALARAAYCIRRADITMLRAYRCPYCAGWHLTSHA